MSNETAVLHHLAIKGRASAAALEEASGLTSADAQAALDALAASGLVVFKDGRMPAYMPTPEGRAARDEALKGDPLRARTEELASWYHDFEGINKEFKELCTAWQLIDEQTPNDHTDAAYDAAIIERLGTFHERVGASLSAPADDRLARYHHRLGAALTDLQAGNHKRFTAPLNESYHDIWMELHEDLLRTFDLKRKESDA